MYIVLSSGPLAYALTVSNCLVFQLKKVIDAMVHLEPLAANVAAYAPVCINCLHKLPCTTILALYMRRHPLSSNFYIKTQHTGDTSISAAGNRAFLNVLLSSSVRSPSHVAAIN